MAVKVTRCPHCQTSFRVREEQLDSARGLVRCGSCLQVFKAEDYFQDDNHTLATTKPLASATPKPAVATTEKVASKPKAEEATKPTAADNDSDLIYDDMDEDLSSELISDDPIVDFNLREPEKVIHTHKNPGLEIDTSIFEGFEANSFYYEDTENTEFMDENSDEAWAAALIEAEEKPKTKAIPSLLTAEREKDDFTGFFDESDVEFIDLDELTNDSKLKINIPKSPVDNVAGLQAEPLSFGGVAISSIAWGWISGILIMLVITAAQVFYFNFDNWTRSPQWRPFYAQLCTYIGCSLPKIQNINNMATQHLVVQTHPKLKGALMIDTLLYNKADYLQPFPDLLLVFRDINERVIASRRFTPTQYLSGELAGQKDMTPKSHTHIAIEIVDPGAEAVSYHIDLLSNQ